MKKKVLLTSMMSIAMLASIASGATYALFTAEDSTNIAVTAGKVAVDAYVDENSLKTYSMGVEQKTYGTFENGGFAKFDEKSNLKLDLLTPGDKASFVVKVDNNSNVNIKYQITLAMEGELAPALASKVTIAGKEYSLIDGQTGYIDLAAGKDIPDVEVEVELPVEAGNKYQEKSANITVNVEALQGNASIPWDGTSDTSWYVETEDEFELSTPMALSGLSKLVDEGTTFEGKTIKLESNMDLNGQLFEPIGSYRFDKSFKGTFDGQGHSILNMSQNTWDLSNGYYYNDCGMGLFGAVEGYYVTDENGEEQIAMAVVKNLVMDGASISGESGLCGTVAAVAAYATFENITVKNSNVADYQYYSGGIVGWASGEVNVIGCNIDSSTTIATQWGDFDNSTGGVFGGASKNSKILIKDTTVACRLDVFNDVTSSYQWYAYRRAGMLIGNSGATQTIDGRTVAVAEYLTCENVTVIYDDWANYTYCEFAGTSWPYVRVQAGISNGAYSNPRYGNPTDANGNKVVDDNHVHNDGEDHHILCVFDQLYGGGQGVYGNPTHTGVTVIYNNK